MTALTPGGHVDEARRYVLESRIATGGMGEVWSARDTVLDRAVAVKVLKTEYADDATFHTRFEIEARHAAALHHPGIAAIFDYGESSLDDGSATPRPYLVMELVDGQPLSALLRPSAPLDPTVAQDLLAQAAEALGVAHAAGIVHRDVKPANLLITPDRQVKVTDFGIARAADAMALTESGQVLGTPSYISPEQAEGHPATAASDVYSLGVVAFECLAGHKPFLADTPVAIAIAHVRSPVPDLPAAVPADLARVVRRSMSKAPEDRFTDGAAFAAALRSPALPPAAGGATTSTQVIAAQAPEPVPAAIPAPNPAPNPAPVPAAAAAPRGRTTTPLALGLVAVAVAVLLAIWLGTRDGDDPNDEAPTDPGQSETTPSPEEESQTPTRTPTRSPTKTLPQTPTESPTETPEPSETPTASPTETPEPTETPTESPSETPEPTETPAPTETPSTSAGAAAGPAGPRTPITIDGEDTQG